MDAEEIVTGTAVKLATDEYARYGLHRGAIGVAISGVETGNCFAGYFLAKFSRPVLNWYWLAPEEVEPE